MLIRTVYKQGVHSFFKDFYLNNTSLEDLMSITCERDMYKNSNKVLETFASNSTELSKMLI